MPIRYEDNEISSFKQWDVVDIDFVPANFVSWGIGIEQVPSIMRLVAQEEIDKLMPNQEHLTFHNFKKLVAYLHRKKYNTSNLARAVQQALDDVFPDERSGESFTTETPKERESTGILDHDLIRDLQQTLYTFASPNLPFSIIADGYWGPMTQRALDFILDSYHLPMQEPSASLIRQLQTISSRVVRLRCRNSSLANAVEHNPFCIIHQDGEEFSLVKDNDQDASLVRKSDQARLFHFPAILDKDYRETGHFNSFSAWFMLLCMEGRQSYHQYSDMLVRTGEDHWDTISQPSGESEIKFVHDPDHELPFTDREHVSLYVRCIPKTNYDIDLIGVYLSGQFQFKIVRGVETTERSEAGKQFLFSVASFFKEPDEAQQALAVPLAKADFLKIFIVRKNRIQLSDRGEQFSGGTMLPPEFYQLITAPEEDILACLTFGLEFAKQDLSLKELF